MHKYRILFLLVGAVFFFGANAFVKAPYHEDFSSFSSSADNLGLRGWHRITDTHTINGTDYKITYSSYTYYYGESAPAIYTTTQQVGSYPNYETTEDILVTPKLTGKLSFWCRGYNYSPKLKLYRCSRNADGSFTKGEEIALDDAPEYYKNKTITVPGEFNGEYVGFWLENVYIDDVKADAAELEGEPEQSFKVTSAKAQSTTLTADSRNSFKLPVKVTVTNNGDLPLAQGDPVYELYLYRGTYSTISYATKIVALRLTEPLEVGETKEMELTFSFIGSAGEGSYFFVQDPFGNSVSLSSISLKEYKPSLKVDRDQTAAYNYIPLDFGFVSESSTPMTITLKNDGAAPLTGLKYTIPDGFAVEGISDIPADGGTIDITVNLTATAPGWYSGALVLTAPNVESQTIEVRGKVLDPEQWNEGFESESIAGGFIVEDEYWKISSTPQELATPGNASWASNPTQHAYAVSKIISPRIEVREGDDPIELFAGRIGGRYDTYSELTVSYSPDRQNWTVIKEIKDANGDFGDELITSPYPNVNLFKRFLIEDIPAGEWYIAFEGRYVNIAQVSGCRRALVEHDVMHIDHNIPAQGRINNPYTASLKLRNLNSVDENDYDVALYIDGKKVATAEKEPFEAGADKEFAVSFVPHATGEMTARVVFSAGNYEFTTDEVAINIYPEVAKEEVTVGEPGGTSSTYSQIYVPLSSYYNYTQSEFIYTEEQLGIPPGTPIVSLTFLGKITERPNETDATVHYSVWLSHDDRSQYASPYSFISHDEMTKVSESKVTYPRLQSTPATLDNPILEVMFDEPFIYQGGNLVVAMQSDLEEGSRNYVNFSLSKYAYQTIYWTSYSTPEPGSLTRTYAPVVIVGTQKPVANVSGTVTYEDEPVENATVRIESGEVYYETVTDESGVYSLEVMQLDRKYIVKATAPGLVYADEEEREFAEGENTLDIVLNAAAKEVILTGTVSDKESGEVLTGATVEFTQGDRTEFVVTENDGTFEITISEPGEDEWTVTVTCQGYVSLTANMRLDGDIEPFVFEMEKDEAEGVDNVKVADSIVIELQGRVLFVRSNCSGRVDIFSVDGRLIHSEMVCEGCHEIATLEPGVYIVAGHKIFVR